MHKLLFSLLILALLVPKASAQDDSPGAITDALVTVHIDGLDDAGWAGISARIGRETDVNLEYGCVRSGIVVLHFSALRTSDKADVIAVVKRLLHEAGIKGAVEFLDVHVEEKAGNKC
ncbi:MAG: hypothetical protein IPL52_17610 [Flavobacteriales bacterium]|nr:hypothetical protein [Flavobacteriales bacterium]